MASDTSANGDKRWRAEVFVALKAAVNDPQGLAVRDGLHSLGFESVTSVRAGKYIELRLAAPDQATAERRVAEMCDTLLANPVMEQYRFTVTADETGRDGVG